MTIPTRDVGGWGGLGRRRYERYRDAFDWVERCVANEYYLEAIAIIDSLINDRLSSRFHYITGRPADSPSSGRVCSELLPKESNSQFRNVIENIREWVKKRNEALHATVKVFRDKNSSIGFNEIRQSYRQVAVDGVNWLRVYDALDTNSRAQVGKRPASSPNAFFPERRNSDRFHSQVDSAR